MDSMSDRNDVGQQPTLPGRRTFAEQTTETVPLAPSTGVPRAPYLPYTPDPPLATAPASPNAPRRRGVSRRAFLIGATAGAVSVGAVGAGVGYAISRHFGASSATLYTSEAGQINHLLRRAGFGPSPTDIGEYLSLGVSGSIDRLLNFGAVSNDALEQMLAGRNFTFTTREELGQWWLLRMLYTARPLEEKLALFWHGLLTSSFTKIGGKRGLPLLIQQNELFRSKGMGRFDDLIKAITADPAMLLWLDGHASTGDNPNENYARELMELFTMGIGNYTQNDVHQGALIFTGWTINRNGQGIFVPKRHYNGTETFLGHTGNLSSDDAIQYICAHPATGPHLAGRLWAFFVHDSPSSSDIKPLVDAYYSQNHSIAAMMKALLTSPAFFSSQAYRARVKSPAEFVVGAVRGLAVPAPQSQALNFLNYAMIEMGQTLFDPPNVAGWDGDKVSGAWMSTQAWLTRVNFINTLLAAASGMPIQGQGKGRRAQVTDAATQNSLLQHLLNSQQLHTPQDVARYFTAALLDGQLSSDRVAMLTQALEQSDNGPGFTLMGGAKLSASALRNMLYLLHSLPEYQMN